MPRRWNVASALVVGAVLVFVGCAGSGSDSASNSADAGAGAQAASNATKDDKVAPAFELPDVDGNVIRLADSNGKIRLVDFWATWCVPCRKEVPMFNELQELYRDDGFEIVGIAEFNDSPEAVREFLTENKVAYRNVLGTEEVTKAYKVFALPSAYLVDREGNIVESFVGPKPRKVLEKKIRELLELPPAA